MVPKICRERGFFAQSKLGEIYATGEGVLEDYVQTYAWWSIAATQGNENAKKNKGIVKSETVLRVLFFSRSSSFRHIVRSFELPRVPDAARLELSSF
tara:strand:- start:424 stop:714 length:291 start_codon:yes stop_codon:yes gene_type:complete